MAALNRRCRGRWDPGRRAWLVPPLRPTGPTAGAVVPRVAHAGVALHALAGAGAAAGADRTVALEGALAGALWKGGAGVTRLLEFVACVARTPLPAQLLCASPAHHIWQACASPWGGAPRTHARLCPRRHHHHCRRSSRLHLGWSGHGQRHGRPRRCRTGGARGEKGRRSAELQTGAGAMPTQHRRPFTLLACGPTWTGGGAGCPGPSGGAPCLLPADVAADTQGRRDGVRVERGRRSNKRARCGSQTSDVARNTVAHPRPSLLLSQPLSFLAVNG